MAADRAPETKIATQLFDFDLRTSPSPYVLNAWRTTSVPDERFISVATIGWEMVITRQEDRTWMTVRGSETKASIAPIPQGAEFIGIRFAPGTFMPSLEPARLVDGEVHLAERDRRTFWLDGSIWSFPSFDDVESLVDRLVRDELIVLDPIVAAALDGRSVDLGERSVQRRIARATGVTRRLIAQVERANVAADMLMRGTSIGDVVSDAGYADQAHLTRSVRRYIGQTPAELVGAAPST
jgi:hypothetical protein